MSSNIVVEWLRSLHLGQYAESFIDNGYDDLEICKQVGDPDLDAIGVFNPSHRNRLLQSVRTLREEGAASVYFTLEETTAIHEECLCDTSSVRSSRTSSGTNRCSEKELLGVQGGSQRGTASPGASSSNGSAQELGKYLDEYEEGKAELVKIPRVQLKLLLRDQLMQDGIRLSCQPYSTSCGERGYLEGLSSRYADLFNTHYGDVLEYLEELRRREWEELSPRIRVLVGTTPDTPPSEGYSPCSGIVGQHTPQSLLISSHNYYHGGSLTTSLSQPIYVPGKYSPSSCLSDKEEDEIYGFGYGVYGKQMMQRQQQQHKIVAPQPNYESCLSPRSAYFYEFPPNEQSGHQTNKKKTSFSRFLRGLKTATGQRKDKHGHSPRHLRSNRVGTPDSMGGESRVPCTGPPDYDRLRYMQINGGATNDFEQTIHRLKVQEVLKKRERFHREHEEILRDIRHGLIHMNRRDGGLQAGDDTYMYDDDARCAAGLGPHWYDEPPFESDPEDFLMDVNGMQAPPVPNACHNSRVCFTLNLRPEPRGEGIISLRTAGDISLPRDACPNGGPTWSLHPAQGQGLTPRGSARRGLLVPGAGNHPATIIDRGSGDYAGSDVQSIGSRLSTMSIETSRSEQVESASIHSPSYHVPPGKGRPFRKLVSYKCRSAASEDAVSHSSDYEDQEETAPTAAAGPGRGSRHEAKKTSRIRAAGPTSPEAFPSASSAESLPSGSGSSTQALVPAGSNHSSVSADDLSPLALVAPSNIIGRARALVDYTSPYDKDALRFKKGDIIDIISMNASGLWKGVVNNRVGTFKFINVEMIPDKSRIPARHRKCSRQSQTDRPGTVEELLKKINLEEHISVFVLNGYEDLQLFKDLENQDLDYLGITDSEHRAKILTAIELLHDQDSGASDDDTDTGHISTSDEDVRSGQPTAASFRRLHFPRDSGCYDASSHRVKKTAANYGAVQRRVPNNFPNNLDSGLIAYKQSLLSGNISEPIKPVESPDKYIIAQQNYLPNIPVASGNVPKSEVMLPKSEVTSPHVSSPGRTLDSYVVARGKLVTVEPCRKTPATSLRHKLDDDETNGFRSRADECLETDPTEMTCEANAKLTMVKYVVGGGGELGCESGNSVGASRGGCFSEKSSDSGVSSSSLSSAHNKDGARKERMVTALTDGATVVSYSCSGQGKAATVNKTKECV